MPEPGSWRYESRKVLVGIVEQVLGDPNARVADVYGNVTRPDDIRPLIRAITDGYPFGERKHTPYKAWLQERQWVLWKVGVPKFSNPFPYEDWRAPLVPPTVDQCSLPGVE